MERTWIMSILYICVILCSVTLGELLMDNLSSLGEWRSFEGKHRQLAKLTSYDIVKPKLLNNRHRRGAITMTEDGHLPEASFVVPIEGEEYILDVWINENLFPSHFVESSYLPGGKKLHRKPHKKHHCYYHGSVRGWNNSNVAISTCKGLSGVIYLNGSSFYIEPLLNSNTEHLVYNAENVIRPKQKLCNYGVHIDPQYYPQQPTHHLRRRKKDVHTEVKYIELLIANDYAEFTKHGSIAICVERSKEMANIMDMIYGQLNIRVALVAVEVWNEGDPFIVSENPTSTMQDFQQWRKESLQKVKTAYNDNAQLVTGKSFEGSTVGMATLGAMCSAQRSGGVNEDHGEHAADVASTMSHEMGHNMGFVHDADDRKCKCEADVNIGCIMEPSSGSVPPTIFSSCTKEDLSDALERGLGACLFDYPGEIYGGPVCGNDYLEADEECDCGPPETCVNECCDPETCTLNVNATCADGECCEDCQLKMAAVLCRGRVNMCDLPEYCTGRSNECPANVYRQNGEACDNKESSDSVCFDGQCLTLTEQCKNIWGNNANVAIPECFDYNRQGSEFGNCGYEKDESSPTGKKFFPCEKKHIKCGKLMCTGGGDYPVTGGIPRASRGYTTNERGRQVTCDSASIDLGQDVPDPGFVANGSPCGHGKVCMDTKCLNLTELHIRACPYNCHGNGVCNSKNHCHCNNEWAPPLCNTPGNGGSMDSGPATPPQKYTGPIGTTVIVLLVIFLLVVPITGITLIVSCLYRRELMKILCKQSKMHRQLEVTETNEVMNNQWHKPQQVARQPPISKHQIQHPHHNNRIEFHDITKVPEKPPAQQGLRKPPSPTSDALRPVRPPPPVPAGINSVSAKPSAIRPSILHQNERLFNSVAARPTVTRPSVLQSGNNSVAARPTVSRPSVINTSSNPVGFSASRPPFLRPTEVVNPAHKPLPLRPMALPKKVNPETIQSKPPVLRSTGIGKPNGSVSSRPQISRPRLVSATTSDDAPARPSSRSFGSVSSKPPPQRPSVLLAKTDMSGEPTFTRTSPTKNDQSVETKPAVPTRPGIKPVTSVTPGVALKPPKQPLKPSPPGRPTVTPKPNANNSAQNRPMSLVAARTKNFQGKPEVSPRPVSVEVRVKPPVIPRKNTANTNPSV